jgi:hypothetical protein
MVRLYLIIAKEEYSLRIKLSALIKIHLVFILNLLYKDKNNLLLGQVYKPEPLLYSQRQLLLKWDVYKSWKFASL